MARRNLTDRFVASRKNAPKGMRVDYQDAVLPGLALRVTDRGHKSFVLVARYPSRPKNPTRRILGTVYVPPKREKPEDDEKSSEEPITGGALTLAEARAKARRWLDLLSRGSDPAQEERHRKAEAKKRITFDELRDAFLEHYKGRAKHGEATRILHKDFAAWNGRLAVDIDTQDVDTTIRVIVDRGSKYQAINAFGYIRTMYSWAQGQPRLNIKASPCAGLSAKTLIGKKRPRTRVLEDDELRAIWGACGDQGYAYPYGAIIKLLLLTGVRENEIAHMSRGELIATPEDGRLLVVPSQRMKGEDDDPPPPHEIPLTPKMVEILDALPEFSAGHYVFTSTGGSKAVNGWSKAKERIDKLSGVGGWRFHDLRRTVRTRISAIPAEEHVREALLAHGRRGIQAHYDQHKYRDEKRRLLEAWEKKLLAIVNPPPPGVTDLSEARARRGASA